MIIIILDIVQVATLDQENVVERPGQVTNSTTLRTNAIKVY